jgi:hypothetical protein
MFGVDFENMDGVESGSDVSALLLTPRKMTRLESGLENIVELFGTVCAAAVPASRLVHKHVITNRFMSDPSL